MVNKMIVVVLVACLCCPIANAGEPGKGGSKWKIIMTIVGAGGGFTLGTFVGLAAYDDAIDSEKKVFTTAFLMSAAGGVAGFFLGRHIDKSHEIRESRIMPGIRWEKSHRINIVKTTNDSVLLRDADPIELLSRARNLRND